MTRAVDLHEAHRCRGASVDVALPVKRVGVEATGDDHHARSARTRARSAEATRSLPRRSLAFAQPARDVARMTRHRRIDQCGLPINTPPIAAPRMSDKIPPRPVVALQRRDRAADCRDRSRV
jgi:hypothetical protein